MGWQEDNSPQKPEPPKDEFDSKVMMLARGMSKLSDEKKDILLQLVQSMSDSADKELKK